MKRFKPPRMNVIPKVLWFLVLTTVTVACATVAARGPGRLTAAEIKSRVVARSEERRVGKECRL